MSTSACSSTVAKPCQTYIQITDVPADLRKAVDEYIDGSVDAKSGKVRWFNSSNRLLVKSLVINE